MTALPGNIVRKRGETYKISHDGFQGTVIGDYERLDGKRGVVLQQDNTMVVHVYGEKWLTPAAAEPVPNLTSTWRKKLELWFFRNLSNEQRMQFFSLFGLPIDDLRQQMIQQDALRRVTAEPAPAPKVTQLEWNDEICDCILGRYFIHGDKLILTYQSGDSLYQTVLTEGPEEQLKIWAQDHFARSVLECVETS